MPDPKHTRIYYEGDDDRVVLEGLRRAGLLAAEWDIAKRNKEKSGKDGLVEELAPFVRPVNGVGGQAVTLVDLDEKTVEQLAAWFRGKLQDEAKSSDPAMKLEERQSANRRVIVFTLTAERRTGAVALIPVGLAGDSAFSAAHGIDRFAVDDHILRLVQEPRVYAAVSELESVSFELAMRKLTEVTELLRRNGIAIRQAKRFLHVLRAVAAVRPSSAVFIEQLMKKASEVLPLVELRAIFHPLVDDLDEAHRLLNP